MLKNLTETDIMVWARTVWGEAEGEPLVGQFAVAWVIRNRYKERPKYGETITGVCLRPRQFSCWNKGTPRRRQTVLETLNSDSLKSCMYAAFAVALDQVADPTGGANHFLNPQIVVPPAWYDPKKVTVRIGNHTFLKL